MSLSYIYVYTGINICSYHIHSCTHPSYQICRNSHFIHQLLLWSDVFNCSKKKTRRFCCNFFHSSWRWNLSFQWTIETPRCWSNVATPEWPNRDVLEVRRVNFPKTINRWKSKTFSRNLKRFLKVQRPSKFHLNLYNSNLFRPSWSQIQTADVPTGAYVLQGARC